MKFFGPTTAIILIIFFIIISVAWQSNSNGITQNTNKTNSMNNVEITLEKTLYKKERDTSAQVQAMLTNKNEYPIYIMNSVHDTLSLVGKVYKKEGNTFKDLNTYDARGNLRPAQYEAPKPIEVKPNASVTVIWYGSSFVSTGPDQINDWKGIDEIGTFKIAITYSENVDTSSDKLVDPKTIESPEFSISQ